MKSFFQLKEYLEIGTDEIVNTYKKATPGELEEATTAIEFPNYFDLSKAEQDKITKMVKKYNVQTPIEKRGRKNVIIADGPRSEMKKLETDLKKAGIKFVATESVELDEAKYSWNDVNKALTKANYMRGNPAHINRVADKFKHKSGNDKNFTLKDVKKNLSAAGIDGAKQHDVMKHMNESVELDESTKNYAQSLAKIADKAKKNQMTKKDLDALSKLAQMMANANESVELDEAPLKMKMRDMKKTVADMVLDADDKTLMKIARMLGKKLYFDKKGNPIMENPEDNEPASPDESSMAIKQAKFIQYVGEEVEEYIENNKKFPEWMQNKLSGLHEKAMSVHAAMGGDYDDDMDEAYKKKTPAQKLSKSLKKSGLDLDKSEKFYRDMLNKYKQDKK